VNHISAICTNGIMTTIKCAISWFCEANNTLFWIDTNFHISHTKNDWFAAIKNENVTPSGTPLCTNPRNNGIAEQEQKGVTTPSELANTLPVKRDLPPSIFLVLSGEKYDRIIPTAKTTNTNNSNTLGTS